MITYSSGLYKHLSNHLLSPQGFPHLSSGMFRPSEASAVVTLPGFKKVVGGCARRVWYRLKGFPAARERVASEIMRMNVGKQVELALIEETKRMGLFVGNNISFQVDFDGVPIAGELDIVLRTLPCAGEKFIVEAKSIFGPYAKKEIFGSQIYKTADVGSPKDSYLMQLGIYLFKFSKLPEDHPAYIPFGCLFICDRGDGDFCVYDVWLKQEHTPLPEGGIITRHRIVYKADELGVPPTLAKYTIEDILDRFRLVKDALETEDPPERDFVAEFSPDQVEMKYSQGEISESAYKKWKSSHGPRGQGKEKLGDWQCNYCEFSEICLT